MRRNLEHKMAATGAERFSQLRRIARLPNEDAARISPVVVLGIALVFAVFFCCNLSSSWKQYRASDLPLVVGRITRHEMVDVDLGSQLVVEYDYQVAGKGYHGNRLRFVYRGFRVGTDDAKKLAATWRVGNNVHVFYDPNSPTNAVLDNTFCKGDELQVGLNTTGLMLSVIVMIGAGYALPRTRETDVVVKASRGTVVIALSNVPLLGAFATLIAIGSLGLSFAALMGGWLSMGDAEIPWLVTAIDYLYVVTVALFVVALTIYVGERASFGPDGRELVIDRLKGLISWSSETLGETVVRDFERIASVQVVSNREDWYRMGRTFSVVITSDVEGNRRETSTLQRSYQRRAAVSLAAIVNSFIASRPVNVLDSEADPTAQPGESQSLKIPESV